MATELFSETNMPYIIAFGFFVVYLFQNNLRQYAKLLPWLGKSQESEPEATKTNIYINDKQYAQCELLDKRETGQTQWMESEKKNEKLLEIVMQDTSGRIITKPVYESRYVFDYANDNGDQFYKITESDETQVAVVDAKVRKLNTRLAIRDSEVSELMTDTSTYNEKISKMMDKMQIKNKFFFPGKQGQGGMPQQGGGGEE
jgi:hypothetical protein